MGVLSWASLGLVEGDILFSWSKVTSVSVDMKSDPETRDLKLRSDDGWDP
jgi:hypothetical protein